MNTFLNIEFTGTHPNHPKTQIICKTHHSHDKGPERNAQQTKQCKKKKKKIGT